MVSRLALLAVLAIACGSNEDRVAPAFRESQLGSPVTAPVERFVTQGRTNVAFADLTVALTDDTVGNPAAAAEAELRLLGLAAPLAEALRSRPLDEQVEALALTVWPTLLAPPLTGEAPPVDLRPRAGEGSARYLERLCQGPLHSDCGIAQPHERAVLVRAAAMRAANERMRTALSTCLFCTTRDQAWDRLGWTWESLDREASGAATQLDRHRYEPVASTANKRGLSEL